MDRTNSVFYGLRKYHNSVKRDLYNRYTLPNDTVLEIGVGKGGDLGKIKETGATKIIGVDVHQESLDEAARRTSSMSLAPLMDVQFYQRDLRAPGTTIPELEEVDIAVANFSFHYFFESDSTFINAMTFINGYLKIGGIFMGTLFDGDSIESYSPNFFEKDFKLTRLDPESNETFGNRLLVEYFDKDLSGAQIYSPGTEYIVKFDRFVQMMWGLGYTLVESNMFSPPNNISRSNRNISSLNRTFVFRRDTDISKVAEEITRVASTSNAPRLVHLEETFLSDARKIGKLDDCDIYRLTDGDIMIGSRPMYNLPDDVINDFMQEHLKGISNIYFYNSPPSEFVHFTLSKSNGFIWEPAIWAFIKKMN